jgi:hypothetical protein
MPAPYHKILSKCDRALVAYLVAREVGEPDQVVPAKRSGDRTLPLVICHSETYSVIRNTGSCQVQTHILIKTPLAVEADQDPDGPASDSDQLTGEVVDALWTLDDETPWDSKKLAAQITAAARAAAIADPKKNAGLADFTAFDVRHIGGGAGIEEDLIAWTERVTLEIDCAPSAVD